ncbi:MAG: FlgO family outer membrane protein [Campylobacterota bacterium]|nr:FlgO family outer membrane protein [Campylobacterota bacterium]
MKLLLTLIAIMFLFTACSQKRTITIDENYSPSNNTQTHQNLDEIILNIADQLLENKVEENTIMTQDINSSDYIISEDERPINIILTSFVNLDQFTTTSTFGRIITESMYNELHIRKFKVTDFRGQDAVSVNADGEFHITRDVEKLKDNIAGIEYILVGTYVKFENESILINARILDSTTGTLISSSRVVYTPKECSTYNICKNKDIDKKTDNTTNVNQTEQSNHNKTLDEKKEEETQRIINSYKTNLPISIVQDY